uniref:EF-hand domain-containing protein n=1 Tax=Pyrodinium bahamense TaxID=73915 RepID=A0A7S0BD47_9DINO
MEAFFQGRKVMKMQPHLRQFFRVLDTSGDGKVQIEELIQAMKRGVDIPPAVRDVVSVTRMIDLFDVLDMDRSGEIEEEEFVDGICQMALTNVTMEAAQILHLLRSFRREMREALNADSHCPTQVQPLPPPEAVPMDSAPPSPVESEVCSAPSLGPPATDACRVTSERL